MIEAALSLPPLDRIAAVVADETGMTFGGPGGAWRLEHAVRVAMARAGVEGDAYLERLEAEPALVGALVDELSVGETYFFRHADQFRFVADEILPERRAARGEGTLRAWSAGCASGEEAYSLAILFAERRSLDRARILATDVSAAALARARRGRYRAWSLRGEGAGRALPFLRREGADLIVPGELRAIVEFHRMNLAAPGDEGPRDLDVVLCRNVLIYLDRAAVGRAVARLFASLAPGGWLVAGPSEPLLGQLAPFEVVTTAAGVYYRRPAAPARPSPRSPATRTPAASRGEERAAAKPPAVAKPARAAKPEALASPGAIAKPAPAAEREAAAQRAGPAAAVAPPEPVVEDDPTADALADAAALLEDRRDDEAALALRRLVYLDPTLAIGHFLLGEALLRRGDGVGARRAFETAGRIARSLPPGEVLPHGEGERAGRLADAAAAAAARVGETG